MKNKKDETRESPPKYQAASSKGKVPRLRFPEFRDSEDWNERALGDIAVFSSGGTPPKDISDYWNGDIPWISASSMHETSIDKSDLNITELAVQDVSCLAKQGSLLILTRGSMLFKRIPICITTRDVAFNQDVKALSVNSEIDNYFLLFQLNAAESNLLSIVGKTGIGAGKLETTDLQELTVYIAHKQEQLKIAACLSSLDSLLAAHAKKLEALKDYKKGLMQLLFPAEGERVPRLRFPEFRAAKDWGNCQLRDISELITKGTTPTTLGYQYSDEGINFIKIESITLEGKLDINKMAHIDLECYDALSRSKLEENDILFSIAGALGVVTRIPSEMLPANTNQALGIVRLKKDINTAFIEHLLKAPKTQKLILGLKSGAAQSNISLQQLGELEICLPSSTEQQKIASTLSSLDSLIAAEARKIEELKEHKRGLMQGLFPSPEEDGE